MPLYRDRRTGEIVELPDQPAMPAAPIRGIPIGAPNPTAQFAAPQAQAQLAQTQTNTARTAQDMALDRERLRIQQMQAQGNDAATALSAAKEGLVRLPDGRFVRDPNYKPPAPTLAPGDRATAIANLNDALLATPKINNLIEAYNRGPGATPPIGLNNITGLADYLPNRPENRVFNAAADQFRGTVKKAQGFTGGEGNTAAEMRMNVGAFIPAASDADAEIVQKMRAIKQEQSKAIRANVALLGGMPDSNGNITPVPAGYTPGEFPALDEMVSRTMGRVPAGQRQSYMLQQRRAYMATLKDAPRKQQGGGNIDALLKKYGG